MLAKDYEMQINVVQTQLTAYTSPWITGTTL